VGWGGSFGQTIDRVQDALDVGLSLRSNTKVSRHTLKDLPRVAELLSTFAGITLWDLLFLVPTGRGARDDVISAAEHEEVYRWLYSIGPSIPFDVKTTLGQSYRRVFLQNAPRDWSGLRDVCPKIARSSTNDG
jgi:MoaA/NifB/PqqE/SkfB family radical SAM enzyme